jgi:hypothetical protein
MRQAVLIVGIVRDKGPKEKSANFSQTMQSSYRNLISYQILAKVFKQWWLWYRW